MLGSPWGRARGKQKGRELQMDESWIKSSNSSRALHPHSQSCTCADLKGYRWSQEPPSQSSPPLRPSAWSFWCDSGSKNKDFTTFQRDYIQVKLLHSGSPRKSEVTKATCKASRPNTSKCVYIIYIYTKEDSKYQSSYLNLRFVCVCVLFPFYFFYLLLSFFSFILYVFVKVTRDEHISSVKCFIMWMFAWTASDFP